MKQDILDINDVINKNDHSKRLGIDINLKECYFLLINNKNKGKYIQVFVNKEDTIPFCERPFNSFTFLDIYLDALSKYQVNEKIEKMTHQQILDKLYNINPILFYSLNILDKILLFVEKNKILQNIINKNNNYNVTLDLEDYIKTTLFKTLNFNYRIYNIFSNNLMKMLQSPNCPEELKYNLFIIKKTCEKLLTSFQLSPQTINNTNQVLVIDSSKTFSHSKSQSFEL